MLFFHKTTMWQLEGELIFDSVETAVDYVSKYWEKFAEPVADEYDNIKVTGTLDNIIMQYDSVSFDGKKNVSTSHQKYFQIKPVTVIVE